MVAERPETNEHDTDGSAPGPVQGAAKDSVPAQGQAQRTAQVLQFRRHRDSAQHAPGDTPNSADDPFEGPDEFARYERREAPEPDPQEPNDTDRHRMVMNAIAVAIVALLVGIGVWLADTIADMQRQEDCLLQGRHNCAPIEVPQRGAQPR